MDAPSTVVAQVMSTDVLVVSEDATLSQAARAMRGRNVGSAIVVDDETRPVGIISERELVESVAGSRNPDQGTVKLWMRSEVATATPEMPLADAAELMRTTLVRHLPVTESGKLIGVVSMRDLLAGSQL